MFARYANNRLPQTYGGRAGVRLWFATPDVVHPAGRTDARNIPEEDARRVLLAASLIPQSSFIEPSVMALPGQHFKPSGLKSRE
jgi:hypothetical protein